jgi:hypothetical protein
LGERTRLLAEAFNAGATIAVLMERHQITKSTVLDHLTKYALAGHPLRDGEDLHPLASVTPERKQAALAAFQELGPARLKPVFDRLNGTVNYDDLKILRLVSLAVSPVNAAPKE